MKRVRANRVVPAARSTAGAPCLPRGGQVIPTLFFVVVFGAPAPKTAPENLTHWSIAPAVKEPSVIRGGLGVRTDEHRAGFFSAYSARERRGRAPAREQRVQRAVAPLRTVP